MKGILKGILPSLPSLGEIFDVFFLGSVMFHLLGYVDAFMPANIVFLEFLLRHLLSAEIDNGEIESR